MPRQLDPTIAEVLKKFHPEPKKAIWDCHGTWVVYHKDVELMAAKAGIVFDQPMIIEANGQSKCAAVCVTAHIEGRSDWSIGEAAPGNNKNAYPYAMAEKRARDRVAIKLLGLHGIYSDAEADDFKQRSASEPDEASKPQDDPAREYVKIAKAVVDKFGNVENLRSWWKDEAAFRAEAGVIDGSPEYEELVAHVQKKLSQKEAA